MYHDEPLELAALDWMLGDWRVDGTIEGRPVRGVARVRRGVEGAVLESRERIEGLDGGLDYEDLSVYCWDGGAGLLRVYHFSAPDQAVRYTVLPLDGRPGIHWMRADLAARVVMAPTDGGWTSQVYVGVEEQPVSALRYSPASASAAINQPLS